jgi:hypothetical protein
MVSTATHRVFESLCNGWKKFAEALLRDRAAHQHEQLHAAP